MKTIQELNSKWYWRLIKVTYVGLMFLGIFLGINGVYFFYNETIQDELMSKAGYIELGESIKATFPKYADRTSEELGRSAIEKYPDNNEYRAIVNSNSSIWESGELNGKYITILIFYALLVIFSAFIIHLLIRLIAYYIILGKFNPEK